MFAPHCARLKLQDAATYYAKAGLDILRRRNTSSAEAVTSPGSNNYSNPVALPMNSVPSTVSNKPLDGTGGLLAKQSLETNDPNSPVQQARDDKTSEEHLETREQTSNNCSHIVDEDVDKPLGQLDFLARMSSNNCIQAGSKSNNLATLADDEVLELLLNNETVVQRFQDACSSRLRQYQQELDHAYDKRLWELEDYTRRWRDVTQEIWTAFNDGKLRVHTRQEVEALNWKGPKEMGTMSRPPTSTVVPKQVRQLRATK